MEQARKKDHPFEITNIAIEKIAPVAPPDFSAEQAVRLQEMHKTLLQAAKDENDGNEVLLITTAVFDMDFIKIYGNQNSVTYENNIEVYRLKHDSYAGDLVFSHNHPSTKGFSFMDIAVFLIDEYIGTSTVVTNQGQIYILHKTESFSYNKARDLLNQIYDQYDLGNEPVNEEKQIKAARELIKIIGKAGVWYGTSK